MTSDEIKKAAQNLQVGDRFFYTGDMANAATWGTVLARIEDKWGLHYSVVYDDCRFEGDTRTSARVEVYGFYPAPGQRFKTEQQYNEERQRILERYKVG